MNVEDLIFYQLNVIIADKISGLCRHIFLFLQYLSVSYIHSYTYIITLLLYHSFSIFHLQLVYVFDKGLPTLYAVEIQN